MLISTILKFSALILLQLRRLQRQSRMQDLIYETRNKTKIKWKIIIETLKIKQGLHSPQLSENECAPKLCFWPLSLSNLSGTQVLCIAVDNTLNCCIVLFDPSIYGYSYGVRYLCRKGSIYRKRILYISLIIRY